MTALADFCQVIRDWLNIGSEVYPDSVVTQWIRMAEKEVSKRLRCKDMVQIDTGTLSQQRYLLPSDWRQLDFVRLVGGRGLRFLPRDDFYNPDFADDQKNCYCLSGNYIIVGGMDALGTQIEITYYQDIPALDTTPTWFTTQYPGLSTLSVLSVASKYAIEDERSPQWEKDAGDLLMDINIEHQLSKASGSRLTQRHRRSFG
jgi:hypothetical protein